MRFSEWLARRTRNRGPKLSATGLNAGGQTQSGMRLRYSVKPAAPPSLSLKKPKLS